MNKSITQATQNDKQISKSIKRFFTRFHIYPALKAANAYKRKGTPNFAKDTVYRFMKIVQINWMRFTTILASRIINNAILPLDSEDRANVLIIDDSMFERNRSTMPCLHFWKLLKKLQFQQNMFFLTAGFHLQFSRCIGTYSSAISLRK